jgi:mannitol-1-phosphate 5-dehydrogenase
MTGIRHNKLVIFGAGRIGRSFIGQLFSRGGYEVVFIDVDRQIVDELSSRGEYTVIIKSGIDEVMSICNVRGVFAGDSEQVTHEVATAGILAVSVGQNGLRHIFPALSAGLLKRYEFDPEAPLDVIIAENMRDADAHFRSSLLELLPSGYPFGKLVGLVETSIGKMVPIMTQKDMEEDVLQVFAEPYNTLILDKKAFRNPIPAIPGLAPKENMKAWVDRKLFIHNLGHATAAYIGFLRHRTATYMWELLADPFIHGETRETMLEASGILLTLYPGEYSPADLREHIDDLLFRFQNKALGDTVFRVGCDLYRKLGPEDRLAGAIRAASGLGLPYDRILRALVCGFHFRSKDEHGELFTRDAAFAKEFAKGTGHILQHVCGFDIKLHQAIFEQASVINRQLRTL